MSSPGETDSKRRRLDDPADLGPAGQAHGTAPDAPPPTAREAGESGGGGAAPGGVGEGVRCLRARDKIHAVERDYTHYFAVGACGEEGADQYVYQHFNTLCVVGLAPSHAALAGGRKVVEVDFQVGKSNKLDNNKVSGKKKSGAIFMTEEGRLCDVVCDDGTRHKVRSCIRGHLLELNERLREEPWLLNAKAGTEGFVAVIQPKSHEDKTVCRALLTEEAYRSRAAPP